MLGKYLSCRKGFLYLFFWQLLQFGVYVKILTLTCAHEADFCVLGWVSGGVWFSNKISFLPTFIILSYNPSLIWWWFELSLNSFPFVVQSCLIFGYSVSFKCSNASYWYGTGRLMAIVTQLWLLGRKILVMFCHVGLFRN